MNDIVYENMSNLYKNLKVTIVRDKMGYIKGAFNEIC